LAFCVRTYVSFRQRLEPVLAIEEIMTHGMRNEIA